MWFSFRYFIIRLVAALAVLFLFYNPSRYCFIGWVLAEPRDEYIGPKALIGAVFFAALVYLAVTTHKTMGKVGVILAVAVLGIGATLIVTNVRLNWGSSALVVLGEACAALLVAFGMSAATFNRLLSGQLTTNTAPNVLDEHHGGGHHS